MRMNENYLEILKQYDFLDGIISGIYWRSNMRDVCIVIDQYLSEYKSREVKIELFNCFNFQYKLKKENFGDVWSQLTLQSVRGEKNREEEILIKFYDSFNDSFLKIQCLDIKIENC